MDSGNAHPPRDLAVAGRFSSGYNSQAMTTKQQMKKLLDELPDDCSIEDVQYRLYVLETIRARLQEEQRGEFIPQDEVEKRMAKWLDQE